METEQENMKGSLHLKSDKTWQEDRLRAQIVFLYFHTLLMNKAELWSWYSTQATVHVKIQGSN